MTERPCFSSSLARAKTASAPSPVSCETRDAMDRMVTPKSYHLPRAEMNMGRTDAPGSECVAQRKLYQSRRTHRADDFAEGTFGQGNRFDIIQGRIAEVCVIPDIEKVGCEAERLAFGELKILDKSEVPILLIGPPENIAAEIAEVGGAEITVRQALL